MLRVRHVALLANTWTTRKPCTSSTFEPQNSRNENTNYTLHIGLQTTNARCICQHRFTFHPEHSLPNGAQPPLGPDPRMCNTRRHAVPTETELLLDTCAGGLNIDRDRSNNTRPLAGHCTPVQREEEHTRTPLACTAAIRSTLRTSSYLMHRSEKLDFIVRDKPPSLAVSDLSPTFIVS